MSPRGRHGHGHFDPRALWHGPWGGMGFGPGGRRSRARRGDVRAAVLLLLEEEPRNGYGLMEEIERRSDGAWRPSPGSVYPALAQLEDEGLIRADESSGRRTFELTDEGRAYVDENREALGSPWDEAGEGVPSQFVELRALVGQLAAATIQVAQAGTPEQAEQAKEVLTEARKSLYRILAEAE
jgi:DNA-binding PadR family transcriptional regulator